MLVETRISPFEVIFVGNTVQKCTLVVIWSKMKEANLNMERTKWGQFGILISESF